MMSLEHLIILPENKEAIKEYQGQSKGLKSQPERGTVAKDGTI